MLTAIVHNRRWIFLVWFLCMGVSLLPALESNRKKATKGVYISVRAIAQGTLAGFDGTSYFDPGSELIYVPKLNIGMGFSLALGYRWQASAIEIAFFHSGHAYESMITKNGTGTINAIDVIYKHFFKTERTVQPYYQISLTLPFWVGANQAVTAKYGSYVPIDDASFFGIGFFGVGGGLNFQAARNIAFHIDGLLRFSFVTDLYGSSDRWEVKGFFTMIYSLQSGISYTF